MLSMWGSSLGPCDPSGSWAPTGMYLIQYHWNGPGSTTELVSFRTRFFEEQLIC